jgi:hypothetical protein
MRLASRFGSILCNQDLSNLDSTHTPIILVAGTTRMKVEERVRPFLFCILWGRLGMQASVSKKEKPTIKGQL